MAYEEVFNVTHRSDMDGIGSAALVMRRFGMPSSNIILNSYDSKSFSSAIRSIVRLRAKNSLIIFTDFGVDLHRTPQIRSLFLRLKAAGNRIIYIDHHPWHDKAISKVASLCDYAVVGENSEFCATELAEKLLFKGSDPVAKRIASIAHTTDFHLPAKGALIKKITSAIEYLNTTNPEGLKKLAGLFARGIFSDKLIDDAYNAYKNAEKRQLALLDKSITHMDSAYRMGIGFGERIQSNTACDRILSKTGADMAIYVNLRTKTAHLRSRKGIDCSKLAVSMHGGGHPQAAGFQPSSRRFLGFNAEGKKRFVEYMAAALKKVYS